MPSSEIGNLSELLACDPADFAKMDSFQLERSRAFLEADLLLGGELPTHRRIIRTEIEARTAVLNGEKEKSAYIKAYESELKHIKDDDFQFGKDPDANTLRFQLQNAIVFIRRDDPNPMHEQVGDVYVDFLTVDQIAQLSLTGEQIESIVKKLNSREFQFGQDTERVRVLESLKSK